MYEELVRALRLNVEYRQADNVLANAARAADVIEKLAEALYDYEHPWTMITSRPMTAGERKEWEKKLGFVLSDDEAIIYTCPLPDDGEEILTCNKYGTIRLDTFEDDPNYGCGLEENGDLDGIIAWMPLPKPPKEET